MTDSSRSIRRQWGRRSGVVPLSCYGFLLWLGVLGWAAPKALSQSVDSTQREFRRSGQREFFLAPVLWQQGGRPGLPTGRGPRVRPVPPAALLERLKRLPPAEREKVLENNRRFQQLPPERQEQLRERLRELQELTPEQRELVEQRFAIFNNLTPKQQEKARKIYEQRWRRMPPERRRALLQEYRRLRALDTAERQQRLDSAELQAQFSSDERDVLAQLIAL